MKNRIIKILIIPMFIMLLLSMRVGFSQRMVRDDAGVWYYDKKVTLAQYSSLETGLSGYVMLGNSRRKVDGLMRYWIEIMHYTPILDDVEPSSVSLISLDINGLHFVVDNDTLDIVSQNMHPSGANYEEVVRFTITEQAFYAVIESELWLGELLLEDQSAISFWMFDHEVVQAQYKHLF